MVRLGRVIQAIERSWRIETIRAEVRSTNRNWRYWQAGARRRLEVDPDGGTTITSGEVSWRYSPGESPVEYLGTTMSYWPIDALIDPSGILSGELSLAGEDTIAGRSAALVIAKPRTQSIHRPFMPDRDQSPRELAIDIERGVCLRAPGFEVTEIAFDEAFDDRLFLPPVPTGNRPIKVEPRHAEVLTTEQAMASSPFPLLAPTLLPEGTRLLTWMRWESRTAQWIGAIYLVEPGPYHTITINLTKTPPKPRSGERWDELTSDGRTVEVLSEPGATDQSKARIVRDGVVVTLTSTLPAATLAEIASSVQPL